MKKLRPSADPNHCQPVGSFDLYPGFPPGATSLGRKAWLLDDRGVRTVYVGQTVVVQYTLGDKAGRNYAIAHLARNGYASQKEIALAFGVNRATVNRLCQKLDREGVGGLVRKTRSDKTPGATVTKVCALRREGLRVAAIGEATGVSARTVRTILRDKGYDRYDAPKGRQLVLEGAEGKAERLAPVAEKAVGCGVVEEEESSEESLGREEVPERGIEVEGSEEEGEGRYEGLHEMERLLASQGRIEEATVVFERADKVAGAGALLAVAVGGWVLLETARSAYGRLRKGFYGLRSTMLGFLMMACLRIKNGESLKGKSPVALGRLLGLDRVFEVKALRRKLREVSFLGKAASWHRVLSKRSVKEEEEQVGTLYVDGHIRAYYGKRKVAKGWCARRRLCKAGTSDTWVNDLRGEPALRMNHEAHPALSEVLPEVLEDARELIGERSCTVVFDRGGWCGRTFRRIRKEGFHFTTYRKGAFEPLAESVFCEHRVERGPEVTVYRLAESRVWIKGYGEVRLIARLCEGGKQTHLVTSKEEEPALQVALELFRRWRQENFFKYMREEYGLDALVDYGVEKVEDRKVPNPDRKVLNERLKRARTELGRLEAAYGKAVEESKPVEDLRLQVQVQRERARELEEERGKLPERVWLKETERADEVKLSVEPKLFTDVVKLAAYRAECELVRRVAGVFARSEDEGHAFVRTVLAQPADLPVEGRDVHVVFAPMSAPRFNRALQALCENVNTTRPTFPETRYRLHFSLAERAEM